MPTDPVSLALAVPLLLLLAGLASLFDRDGGWLAGSACLGAVVLAGALVLQPGTPAPRLSLREGSTARIEAAAARVLERRDRDGDRLLQGPERAGLTATDLDGDGALGPTDLLGALAARADVWLAVGALDGGPARGHRATLFVPADLGLGAASGVVALVLALLGLAVTLRLGGAGGGSEGHPRAWLCLSLSAGVATALAGNLLLTLGLWFLTVCLVALTQQAASLAGGPNRFGAGSLLGLGLLAAALLGSLLLLGPTPEAAPTSPRLASLGLLLLAAGVAGPALILPFRPVPSRRWGLGLALSSGALLPLATLILLRAGAPRDPAPALATLAAVGAALAGLRALAQTRLDAGLTWLLGAGSGLVGVALLLTCPPALTLSLALCVGLALAALALVGEAAQDLSGGVELERLGGLRRVSPSLCVAGLAALAALVALPPLPAFHAQRALFGHALGAGPVGALALLPAGVALIAITATAVRLVTLTFRGSRPATGPAVAAPRTVALPALLLAGLAVGGAPLLGAGLIGEPPAWSLQLSEVAGLPDRIAAGAGLLVGLALICGLSLAAWILLGPHRQAPLAPPGTRRGWILAIDTRFENLTPQRRLVQPVLRLATKLGARDVRRTEAGAARAGRAWAALRDAARPEHTPRAPTAEADDAPAAPRPALLDPALRDAALLVTLAALLILAVQRLS